jgi:hypothetical protein
MPVVWRVKFRIGRALAALSILIVGSGLAAPLAVTVAFAKRPRPQLSQLGRQKISTDCNAWSAFQPLATLPPGVVFAPVDLAPRLITLTHHDSITGPYHRNGQQIADVMNAFRGDADQAHRLLLKYHSNYLLICPAGAGKAYAGIPHSFFDQLGRGPVPIWLARIQLPSNSPFKMWRVEL